MIKFHSLIPGGIPPGPASKSAEGNLPTRGFRYCEALRLASSYGWYVYLPLDLWLLFDGDLVEWSINEGEDWYPLADAVQYPGFANQFDTSAPDDCKGYAPPFLTRTPASDVVQIWTGVIAATEPGISLLVRAPANFDWRNDFEMYEGIVETDSWFGPLFTNIKLHKIGRLITIRRSAPFIQLQPVSRDLSARTASEPNDLREGLDKMDDDAWSSYYSTVVRRVKTRQRPGEYAAEARKRARAVCS